MLAQIEIGVLLFFGGQHFKDHGEHCLFLSSWFLEGTGAISSAQRKPMLSRQSASRIASRCIKCVPRLILMSRLTGAQVKASNSQRASSSGIRPSHSPRMIAIGERTCDGS